MYADKRWDTPVVTPVQLPPERQALLDAAAYIEQHGWCQGQLTLDEAVCAAGAIIHVAPRICESVGRLLSRSFGGHWLTVPLWNDAPGRTKDEVVAAMRTAAFKDYQL